MPETKNNHYIPQFYLSMWTDPIKKQTFCLNKKLNIFFNPTHVISVLIEFGMIMLKRDSQN